MNINNDMNNIIYRSGSTYLKINTLDIEGKISDKKITEEQAEIVLYALTGNDFKVNAFAGTGKTTTIKCIAYALELFNLNQKTIYLAFNKDIAKDVGQHKPYSMSVYTFHQLARSSIIERDPRYVNKLKNPFVNYLTELPTSEKYGYFKTLDYLTFKTSLRVLNDFCRAPCQNITEDLVKDEYVQALIKDKVKKIIEKNSANNSTLDTIFSGIEKNILYNDLKQRLITFARLLWQLILNPENDIQLTFDVYLKYWSLTSASLNCNTLLIDESQDIDPVMIYGLNQIKSQKIYVGDKNQQIYRWRGAVNALDSIESYEMFITESFRLTKQTAHLANKILLKLGNQKSIVTNKDDFLLEVDKKYTLLCRTNLSILKNVFDLADSKKVCITSSNKGNYLNDIFKICSLIVDFKNGLNSNHILFQDFSSFKDLKEREDELSNELYQALKILDNYQDNLGYIKQQIKKVESNVVESEDEADIVISTAHLSKGREWDFIKIDSDFEYYLKRYKDSSTSYDLFCDELRLFYVTITRAKKSILNESYVNRVVMDVMN